jgi:hypothetical protein
MFRSKVTVDLPSIEQKRSMGPIEWVRSLFGAQIDLGTGKEELTMTAWSTLEGLYRSLQRAGVRDAISFLVDRKAIYVDSSEIEDDLSLVWKSAREKRVLDKPFKEMHLVLAHREGGLHLIFDIKIHSQVLLGDPELVIDISGRPEALRIRPGESAEQFTARVRSWADEPAERERLRLMMQARLELIADLPGAVVDVQAAYVELIKPDARRISALGKLEFGDEAAEPGYHTVPTKRQPGAYGMDPYRHYYYDPYWDLASYMMISSMFAHSHAWHSPHVVVVNTQGQVLHTGEDIPSSAEAGWNESAVSVGEEGLQIDPEVEAEAESMGESEVDPGEAGEAGESEAGESEGGWGEGESADSSDSGDSSSSDSSCSSGDGGSCGSSCGGGCGGGD